MKKRLLVLGISIILIISLFILTGCSNDAKDKSNLQNNQDNSESGEKSDIVDSDFYSWVLKPTIEADDIIDTFKENVSIIKENGKYNLIDMSGKKLLKESYDDYFFTTTEIVMMNKNGDKYNHYVVNDDYSVTYNEYLGFDGNRDITYYYNTSKKEFFTQNEEYRTIDKLNLVNLNDYMKIHNTALKSFREADIKEKSEFIEAYTLDERKYGYYNQESMQIEIPATYDYALEFYENYAAVKLDGKSGYIDRQNNKIFDFEFEEARSFDNGKAWVKANGKWGVIELNNKEENLSSWEDIYTEFLLGTEIPESIENNLINPYIYFLDFNFDGIPDLFYYDGQEPGVTGVRMEKIYSINEDGKVEEMATLEAGNADLSIIKVDEKYMMATTVQMYYHTFFDGFKEVTDNTEKYTNIVENEDSYPVNNYDLSVEYNSKNNQSDKEKSIKQAIENYKPYTEYINHRG